MAAFIGFYFCAVASVVFILSAIGLLLGIGDGGSSAAASQLCIAGFFAVLAWFCALEVAE